jgi:putative nucleotidyltransferase with HDIG domain
LNIFKEFQIRIMKYYLIGSLLAVFGVGSAFIFHTLEMSRGETYYLLLIMFISVAVMIIGELLVYRRDIRPIKMTLTSKNPSLALIEEAFHTAHRFPLLTVRRILGPHFLGISITATLLTSLFIYLGYIHFPYSYIIMAWIGALLVAIIHAIIEFFLSYRSTQPLITHLLNLANHLYGATLTLPKKDIISIKRKLLITSAFIAIIPIGLFVLASEVRLKLQIEHKPGEYWEWAFVILIVIVFLGIFCSLLLYDNIKQPIGLLKNKMNQVQKGQLELIENIYSDEFRHLIDGFNHMVMGIQERDKQNEAMLDSIFTIFAATLDARDPYTAGHSIRVAEYTVRIAKLHGLSPVEIELIRKSALLHDIGKIGVRDAVLLKEGNLTDKEFEQIKQHTVIGAKILEQVHLPVELEPILSGVKYHHERYDGKGYPVGLSEVNIPLFGRIMAVADAYDAMTSDRPYRKGMPKEKALAILVEGKGTQWDPIFVDLFVRDFGG